MAASKLKILFYDLETAPLLAYIWHPADDYVPHDRLIHDSFILTWAAKWEGEAEVLTGTLTSKEAKDQDDRRIVKRLADLIREADIVVAHNGNRFDLPMFNNRLLRLGIEPLGPVKMIDTLKLAKANFRLAYNKLDYLAEILLGDNKIHTEFELWEQAYHGDKVAIAEMSRYNVKDVVLLERVFEKLRPYVKGLDRLVEPTQAGEMACPTCGSPDLVKRGSYRTNASTFQKYQCDNCKRYCRARTALRNKLGVHPL